MGLTRSSNGQIEVDGIIDSNGDKLQFDAIADGEFVKRDGDRLVGAEAGGAAATALHFNSFDGGAAADVPIVSASSLALLQTPSSGSGNMTTVRPGAIFVKGIIEQGEGDSSKCQLTSPGLGLPLRLFDSGDPEPNRFFIQDIVQQSPAGVTTDGFTAGAGAAVLVDSTFTGDIGASAYTMSDIVNALKQLKLLPE